MTTPQAADPDAPGPLPPVKPPAIPPEFPVPGQPDMPDVPAQPDPVTPQPGPPETPPPAEPDQPLEPGPEPAPYTPEEWPGTDGLLDQTGLDEV